LPALLDICLISHDHYDHLDKESVRALQERVRLWIVPLGVKRWMIRKGHIPADRIIELEWWESVQLERDDQFGRWSVSRRHALRDHPFDQHPATNDPSTVSTKDGAESRARRSIWITGFPVQHWASRTFWDRNTRLWLSYAVLFGSSASKDAPCFYFAGDTAWPRSFPLLFAQIRAYLPRPIDLAAIPIGAYAPALFNQDSHTNPPEAVQVHQSLGARQSVAIHHGCFPLSEEPLDEPAAWLPRAVAQAGLSRSSFVAIPHGTFLDASIDAPPATVSATNGIPSKAMGARSRRRRGRAVPPRHE
jgi:L-ascorbate metabolism protein UlaG (beta-lactamase superfamily)